MTPAAALAASNPAPAPPPADAPTDAPSPERARIEQRMAMLARLAQIGMEIAEACGREARAAAATAKDGAAPSPDHPRDIGLIFARTARAVRMTIALEQRLAGDLADLDLTEARAQQARKDDRRIRLSHLVDQAARSSVEARRAAATPAEAWARRDDEAAVEAEIERLADDAYERLTDAEDGLFDALDFDEAVAAIAKDLGLSPDWAARLRGAMAPPDPGAAPYNAPSVAPGYARSAHDRLSADQTPASQGSMDPLILPCEAGEVDRRSRDGGGARTGASPDATALPKKGEREPITPAAPASAPPPSGSP